MSQICKNDRDKYCLQVRNAEGWHIAHLQCKGDEKRMKRIVSVVLVAILSLSAMVMFATPAMADGLLELDEPEIDGDPVKFTGTVIMGDGPWANKDVMIAKWNDSSETWGYYPGLSENMTDSDGNYEIGWVNFTPDGHFGMFVKERSDQLSLEHLIDEKDLTEADFTEQGDNTNRWLYDGGWNYEIPEFTTIAIPAIAILGLFAFYRRKYKK